VQHIETFPVRLLPIKLALVVLRAECSEQTLGLLAAVHDGPRLGACLSRRAISKDELLLLLLSRRSRGRRSGEESADVAEGQADALAALRRVLGFLRALVRVHAVHPARVGLEAHDEERVVRERDALRRPTHPTTTTTGTASAGTGTAPVVTVSLVMIASSGEGESILFRPERHGALRAEGKVRDARAAYDIHRLVRVLRDVVRARAVELDEHVVYGML